MAIASKFHHASDKVSATVSQGTRRDASGQIAEPRFESYGEEYDWLVGQKREIDRILTTDFCKSAYSQAQTKVRREYSSPRSLTEWLKVRSEMDRRRGELVTRKADIEQKISQVKPKLRLENSAHVMQGKDIKRIDYGEQLVLMNRTLLEILDVLKDGKERHDANPEANPNHVRQREDEPAESPV